MPGFSGIQIALQSILTHQAAIDIVNHNVANSSTVGYHRQEAVLIAGPSYGAPGISSSSTMGGMIGTGVVMTQIRRYNVDFMDTRYRSEQAIYKQWSTESDYMAQVEDSLQETGASGMSTKLDTFWNAWKDVATTPEDSSLRATLLEDGKDLVRAFTGRVENLTQIQKETNLQVQQRVDEINTLAMQIAGLNNEIGRYNSPSTQPNNYLDQQALYLDRLAEISGARITMEDNGQAMVSIGGHALVQGISTFKLETTTNPANNQFLDVNWEDGQSLNVSSGELSGLKDLRDNVIDNEIEKLNTLAASIFTNINAMHSAGYGLNDTVAWNPPTTPGRNFFVVGDPSQFAASISVNSALEDLDNIAAAQDPGLQGDGRMAEAIFHFQVDTSTGIYKYDPTTGTVVDTGKNESMNNYNSNRVTDTSLTIRRINTLATQHENLVDVMKTQRESTTGVNLDEEAANLVKYQRSYNASIRMMTAVDEMLDRVINNMGRAGL